MPFFSVIVPVRNRPDQVKCALESILAQDFTDYEIVIVDDGSSPSLVLNELVNVTGTNVNISLVSLESFPRGRGPGFARNAGVWASSGKYCTFLDDDDLWIRSDHLPVAYRAISCCSSDVGLFLSNQEAYSATTGEVKPLWLHGLGSELCQSREPSRDESYSVSIEKLLEAEAFCHLNTTIVSRALFDQISGIDEYLCYEEDLDFYLRAIANAGTILFRPEIVARHNVPTGPSGDNISRSVDYRRRLNTRLHLLNKNILAGSHPRIEAYCRQYLAYTMKHIVESCLEEGQHSLASYFAWRALGCRFSAKWWVYCLWLSGKSWFVREDDRG